METVLFTETTTLGVRGHLAQRRKLSRTVETVQTDVGAIRIKVGRRGGRVVTASPEFEDCRRIASNKRASLKEVQQAALAAFHKGRKNE